MILAVLMVLMFLTLDTAIFFAFVHVAIGLIGFGLASVLLLVAIALTYSERPHP